MKTAIFTTILALGFLSACSNKPSAECQKMYKHAMKISAGFLGESSKADKKKVLKKFEEEWANMSKEERKKANKQCAESNKIYEALQD